jgi:hypothetical protein
MSPPITPQGARGLAVRPAPIRLSACTALILALSLVTTAQTPVTQGGGRQRPLAVLQTAPVLEFPAPTDSNSPAFWLLFRGMQRLVVMTSAPDPVIGTGPHLGSLDTVFPTMFRNEINGARWMEAVVPDHRGVLYGYYHNEPAGVCANDGQKTAPRIGAAKSINGGLSWIDLGLIIEAAPGPLDCSSPNRYFAGGVGDFSVILHQNAYELYVLFSSYGPAAAQQGVAAARMRWSDRDEPQGQVAIWSAGAWRYPEPADEGWVYPPATPFIPVRSSWYDRRGEVDAFWGPSVHWNTFLERYVMLLNRAEDAEWTQEGIYLSSTTTLDRPESWSVPHKLLDGGRWYPQVMGLETGSGTDKLAGEQARFFMSGRSEHVIVFQPREGTAVPRD